MDTKLKTILDSKHYMLLEDYLKNNDVPIKDIDTVLRVLLSDFEGELAKKIFFNYKDKLEESDYLSFCGIYLGIFIVLEDEVGLANAKNEIIFGPYINIQIEEFRNHLDEYIFYLRNIYSKDKEEDEIDVNKTKKLLASDGFDAVLTGLSNAEILLKEGIDLTNYIAGITRKYTNYSLKFYYLVKFLILHGRNDSYTIDKFGIPVTFSLSEIRKPFLDLTNEITLKLTRAETLTKDVGVYHLFYQLFVLVEAYLLPEKIENVDINTLFRVVYDITTKNLNMRSNDPILNEFPYVKSLYDEYKSFVNEALNDALIETLHADIGNNNKISA